MGKNKERKKKPGYICCDNGLAVGFVYGMMVQKKESRMNLHASNRG